SVARPKTKGSRRRCKSSRQSGRDGDTLRPMTEGAASVRCTDVRQLARPRMSSPDHFDVIVLGAGVIGVNAAYWNLRNGKSVCVIGRQPAAGLETSFANGGQVSVSHAEPWANPSAPLKVLKWLFQKDAPLLFRP